MARKSRRRPATRTRRIQPAQPAARPPAPAPRAAPPPGYVRGSGSEVMVRAVEMSLAPATTTPAGRRPARLAPDSRDPSIPLDRVPFFARDLARLGVIVGCMLALLFVSATFIIPRVAG